MDNLPHGPIDKAV